MQDFKETAVKTVKVKRERLLTALKHNLETHGANFVEAEAGYKKTRREMFDLMTEEANLGIQNLAKFRKALRAFDRLEEPRDHSDSYLQAIDVMEWEVDEEVTMSDERLQLLCAGYLGRGTRFLEDR